MKANTMILAVLLFISALGNILLVINPENASKVHNLTLGKSTSNSAPSSEVNKSSKPIIVVKDYFVEVQIENHEKFSMKYEEGYKGNDLYSFCVNIKNISKKPQTIYMDDFVLMDEDGNEYSPQYDYYKRGYDAFFRFELNPRTSKRGISVNFIIPSDSKKKYTLCTNKDYIKLTTSKNGKK